jgi:hypothetical protein
MVFSTLSWLAHQCSFAHVLQRVLFRYSLPLLSVAFTMPNTAKACPGDFVGIRTLPFLNVYVSCIHR